MSKDWRVFRPRWFGGDAGIPFEVVSQQVNIGGVVIGGVEAVTLYVLIIHERDEEIR